MGALETALHNLVLAYITEVGKFVFKIEVIFFAQISFFRSLFYWSLCTVKQKDK